MPKLSLILPVYNERPAIDRTIDEVVRFAGTRPDWECLLVDDGSRDGTAEHIAARLAASLAANVRLIALTENHGKGHAVRAGFAEANGEFLCFTDGDLPYSLDQVARLEEKLADHDVAIGSRNLPGSRNEGVARRRKILGTTFNRLARGMMGLPYADTQAGLKGFRRIPARRLFSKLRTYDFSFDVEILYLARKYGYRVAEVPVSVSAEHSYKTSKIKLMKDSLRMLRDLCRIRIDDACGRY